MASFLTETEVLDAAIAYFSTAFADSTGKAPPMGPRSFFGQLARALASLIGEVLATAKTIDDDALPYVYTDSAGVTKTRNTSQRLDDFAYIFGLPSDVSGKYGRRGATAVAVLRRREVLAPSSQRQRYCRTRPRRYH